ncbi:DUF4912 domain-containing protein [Neobacillus sp. SM06]|uniref:DUF4912 domain-containing protein n=1 Tax=Neobacillus sp. SM06 TaxID=3422492 RepID=UPI003D2BA185
MLDEMIKRRRNGFSFRQVAKGLKTTAGSVRYRWHKEVNSNDHEKQSADHAGSFVAVTPVYTTELVMKQTDTQKVALNWQAVELPKAVVKHFFQADFDDLVQVIRIYDVTKRSFIGSNAHHYYELAVSYSHESWNVKGLPSNRSYIAELGVKMKENDFFPILRSNSVQLGCANEIDVEIGSEANGETTPVWLEHVSTYSYYQETSQKEMETKND